MKGAQTATRTKSTSTAAPQAASGLRMNCRTSCRQGDEERASGVTAVEAGATVISLILNSRVEESVAQIGDNVRNDHRRRQYNKGTLQHG